MNGVDGNWAVNLKPLKARIRKGKNMNIFGDKTRGEHFRVGVALAACFTILCVLGAMFTAEYKDRAHGGKWDWSDLGWGMAGGVVGQIVQLGILALIFM